MKKAIIKIIEKELKDARTKFEPMHSPHEGYATLKEEIEELQDELMFITESFKELWFFIKKNDSVNTENIINIMKERRENLVAEAVQVAAMIERFYQDICEKS